MVGACYRGTWDRSRNKTKIEEQTEGETKRMSENQRSKETGSKLEMKTQEERAI